MELKKRRTDGVVEIEELHLCVLCYKMVNINKEKFSHIRKVEHDYYAHETCVLKGKKYL